MIAIDTRTAAPQTKASQRILTVTRLHFVNRWTAIYLPWIILAFIFAINLAIWAIIARAVGPADRADLIDGSGWSGASLYLFVYMLVVAVQAVNLTFPFAQGYSVTRRDFYLGTTVAFGLLAIAYGAAFTLLSFIEEATGGWGLGGRMFTAFYFGDGQWYQRLFLFVIAFAFFLFFGAATATVYVRWRQNGMYMFFAALALLLIGGVALVTMTDSWPAVGAWFVSTGAYGFAAWLLVPTVLAGLLGYLVLRRATPRN